MLNKEIVNKILLKCGDLWREETISIKSVIDVTSHQKHRCHFEDNWDVKIIKVLWINSWWNGMKTKISDIWLWLFIVVNQKQERTSILFYLSIIRIKPSFFVVCFGSMTIRFPQIVKLSFSKSYMRVSGQHKRISNAISLNIICLEKLPCPLSRTTNHYIWH